MKLFNNKFREQQPQYPHVSCMLKPPLIQSKSSMPDSLHPFSHSYMHAAALAPCQSKLNASKQYIYNGISTLPAFMKEVFENADDCCRFTTPTYMRHSHFHIEREGRNLEKSGYQLPSSWLSIFAQKSPGIAAHTRPLKYHANYDSLLTSTVLLGHCWAVAL